jgi:hypothetical protein
VSYDVTLSVDTGGKEPAYLTDVLDENYTYNVSPMFYDALGEGGLNGLHGMDAGEAAKKVQIAIALMTRDQAKYEAMNPSNGWGDYHGALRFLRAIGTACTENPKARVVIS